MVGLVAAAVEERDDAVADELLDLAAASSTAAVSVGVERSANPV
jgi:hypothetical protein